MEPPSKRLRLDRPYDSDDEENQDELSMTPTQFDARQDPMYQLDKGRAKAATRLKSTFEDIFKKYEKDFTGTDDVINFYTDEIEVDNGHVLSLENRKDGAEEDSISSDEEERIMRGKSGISRKRSQSKSLIPANPYKYNMTPQSQSPWNLPSGLGAYRLSSIAFPPSPYDLDPPFAFGAPQLSNSLVDPVWQAPDLPVQPIPYPQGSLLAIGGSQPGSANGLIHRYGPKRIASAKSFIVRDTSPSKASDGDAEEDDILLGRGREEILSPPQLYTPEKPPELGASSVSSPQPNQENNIPGRIANEQSRYGSIEDSSTEEASAPKHATQEGIRPPLMASVQNRLSPSRPKRGRPRKVDSSERTISHNQEPKGEEPPRLPNQRRIEIVISKRIVAGTHELQRKSLPLLQEDPFTAPEQANKGASSDNVPFRVDSGQTEVTVSELPESLQEPPQERRRSSRTRKQADLFSALTWPKHGGKSPKNTQDDSNREPKSSQTGAGGSADPTNTQGLPGADSKSDYGNESEQMVHGNDFSTEPVDVDQNQPASDINGENGVEPLFIDENSVEETLEDISGQPPMTTGGLADSSTKGTIETSNHPSTETTLFGTIIPQRTENLQHESEGASQRELDFAPVVCEVEKEVLQTPTCAEQILPASKQESQSIDVVGDSEIAKTHEGRVSLSQPSLGSRSPELSALHETVESDPYHGVDNLTLTPDMLEAFTGQGIIPPNSVTVIEDDIPQTNLERELGSIQRSPSLGAISLPNREHTIYADSAGDYATSELVLRISSRQTESNNKNVIGLGRSASPELGTAIEPKAIRGTTSRNIASPAPTTPKKRDSKGEKSRSSHRRTPSPKKFPLTSLIPDDADDMSDDELSVVGSVSSTTPSRRSPFSHTNITSTNSQSLPPLHSTPRKISRKHSLLIGSPSTPSSSRTPNRTLGQNKNTPPATDSRAMSQGRRQAQTTRNSAFCSSPLARTVAERLLGTPSRRHRTSPTRSPSLVRSPHGTVRRCGENGFVCDRDFCFTCCK
ncbi:hypothetical protein F5Y19DRAFT_217978 [Xylariaceae sp. FL1651]|nr:hypothetical protein F5Y19DRAFT_217978 [Xylariaceae sp. FL1651]